MDIHDVYRTHGRSVLRRARWLLGNDHDAEEVVQDVFLSLINNPRGFAGRSSLYTWLYAATTHACLNRIRNRKHRQQLLQNNEACVMPSEMLPMPAEQLFQLRQLLSLVEPKLAEVATYAYLDEMTRPEIADVMGISLRQVGLLLNKFLTAARAAHDVDFKVPALVEVT